MIGFVEQPAAEDLSRQVNVALAAVGLSGEGRKGGYVDAAGRTINCIWSAPTAARWPNSWPAWAVFPIAYDSCELRGAEFLVSVFRALCRGTATVIARSFHPTGLDMVNEEELGGRVDYVDWIQYYSPRVAAAIGPTRIRSGGFSGLEEFSDGAFLCLARASYNGGDIPERKGIVERLGLMPRRVMVRNPRTGEPTQFNWLV